MNLRAKLTIAAMTAVGAVAVAAPAWAAPASTSQAATSPNATCEAASPAGICGSGNPDYCIDGNGSACLYYHGDGNSARIPITGNVSVFSTSYVFWDPYVSS